MPIYNLECTNEKCAYTKEELLSMEAGDRVSKGEHPCPKCGHPLKKEVTASNFRLGGGGYYETECKPRHKQRNIKPTTD